MRKLLRRGLALGLVAGLVAVPASIPALAQNGTPANITHQQSVLSQLSATGELDSARVFTQLMVAGDGPVEVELPNQSTRGLRNLGGLGRPNTDGDSVIYGIDATPDGVLERTVANHTADLPVSLEVEYELDGETLENPNDLVGRSGELEVTYKLRNETVEAQELELFNARQEPTTETVDVGVPMVGTISLPLDDRFADVRADGANLVGDGRGNTIVNWSLVLFEPLGSFDQEVSWTAQVRDAMVPPANAQIAPVSSDSFPSLPNAQSAYADTFAGLQTITDGAVRIDFTMIAILDGAGQLLDGMRQLADGSGELADGLVQAADGSRDLADGTGQAAAGSRDLADGTGQAAAGSRDLADGTGQALAGSRELGAGTSEAYAGSRELAAGTGQASDGSQELAAGLGELRDGAGQLATGAGQIDDGMNQLADGLTGEAAPGARQLADGLAGSAVPGAKQILDGINGLLAAVGLESHDADDGTILGGLNALIDGLRGTGPEDPGFAGGLGALVQLTEGLSGSFGPDPDDGKHAGEKTQEAVDGLEFVDDVLAAITDVDAYEDFKDTTVTVNLGGTPIPRTVDEWLFVDQPIPFDPGLIPAVFTVLDQLTEGLQANVDGLGDWPETCDAALLAVQGPDPSGLEVIRAAECISAQLDEGLTDDVIPGLLQLRGGMNNPACDLANPTDPANPCGFKQVLGLLSAGQADLVDGLGDAAGGADALADGIDGAASGSRELAAGTGQLSGGAGELATGAGAAATGGRELSDGLAQIDTGAKALSGGLGQIDDGVDQLVDGYAQIDTGANQLSGGLGEIDDGANQLSGGLGQIDDGANQLADGLGDARDGSGQLAEGMGDAYEGGQSLVGAMDELQEFGTNKILNDVSRAGLQPDRLLKQARAADDRAKAGDGLPYGTADGANASAIYQFEIAGVGSEEGLSTPVRAGAAVLAFGAVGALGLGVRRFLI